MKEKTMASSLVRYLDLLRGQYIHGFQYQTLFVSSCPKSASTWFANLLARTIPAYHYFHPDAFRDRRGAGMKITESVMHEFSRRRSVARAHIPATEENLAAMNECFGRYVALVRDPRDVALSIYYHLQRYPSSSFLRSDDRRFFPWTQLDPSVRDLEKEPCLDVIIDQLMPEISTFIGDWLATAADSENCLLLQYEDVTTDPIAAVQDVLRFFEIRVGQNRIHRSLEKYGRQNLAVGQWKFRKGSIGDWRSELSPRQRTRLEEVCHECLRRYELRTRSAA